MYPCTIDTSVDLHSDSWLKCPDQACTWYDIMVGLLLTALHSLRYILSQTHQFYLLCYAALLKNFAYYAQIMLTYFFLNFHVLLAILHFYKLIVRIWSTDYKSLLAFYREDQYTLLVSWLELPTVLLEYIDFSLIYIGKQGFIAMFRDLLCSKLCWHNQP